MNGLYGLPPISSLKLMLGGDYVRAENTGDHSIRITFYYQVSRGLEEASMLELLPGGIAPILGKHLNLCRIEVVPSPPKPKYPRIWP